MSIATLSPEKLKGRAFRHAPTPDPEGRVEVWKPPIRGREYVMGFDAGYGLSGRDFDTISVMDITSKADTGIPEQVAEAEGHWGPALHTVAFALHRWYNNAFVLGEAQVGLFTLRWLWDHYGVRHMYRRKDHAQQIPHSGDNERLGWHKGANDLALATFREAVAMGKVVLRSSRTVEQMKRMQWRPRTSESSTGEREGDERLTVKLRGGGSPDLVMASMYGYFASTQVAYFPRPKPMFPVGSLGDLAGLESLLKPKDDGGAMEVVSLV